MFMEEFGTAPTGRSIHLANTGWQWKGDETWPTSV